MWYDTNIEDIQYLYYFTKCVFFLPFQVQLLVQDGDVESYKQIKGDLDDLRNLVEKSELWVYKSRSTDEDSTGGTSKKKKKKNKDDDDDDGKLKHLKASCRDTQAFRRLLVDVESNLRGNQTSETTESIVSDVSIKLSGLTSSSFIFTYLYMHIQLSFLISWLWFGYLIKVTHGNMEAAFQNEDHDNVFHSGNHFTPIVVSKDYIFITTLLVACI